MSGRRLLGLLDSQGRWKVYGNLWFLHHLIFGNVINIYKSRELRSEFQPSELMQDFVHQPYSIYSNINEIEQTAAGQVRALVHASSLALRFQIARRPVIPLSIWRVCTVRVLSISKYISALQIPGKACTHVDVRNRQVPFTNNFQMSLLRRFKEWCSGRDGYQNPWPVVSSSKIVQNPFSQGCSLPHSTQYYPIAVKCSKGWQCDSCYPVPWNTHASHGTFQWDATHRARHFRAAMFHSTSRGRSRTFEVRHDDKEPGYRKDITISINMRMYMRTNSYR